MSVFCLGGGGGGGGGFGLCNCGGGGGSSTGTCTCTGTRTSGGGGDCLGWSSTSPGSGDLDCRRGSLGYRRSGMSNSSTTRCSRSSRGWLVLPKGGLTSGG